ncbi:Major facilitator superfamily transporter [Neonectria punicea]|uniref:Major facilitator superfamily transporter n=1 Tax=Neonectria punicea TaxID=979145 RepID=A0ABR1H3L2_9HYPO
MAHQGTIGSDSEEEQPAGTSRIIKWERHEATLIPHPTTSCNDPLNWSPWRKYWHAFLVLFIVGLTAATSNSAGSASDALLDMGISYDIDNIGAGVLFAGIGYTTFLLSPLPALYGRRSTYLICLLSSVAGSIWFAKTKSSTDAIWSQLFVGASESCAEAAAQLSLSELFYSHQRGSVLGLYILATSVGTFLGPLFAGFIADNDRFGWTWIGWFAAIISIVTLIAFLFGFEETTFDRRAVLNGVRPMSANPTAAKTRESWSRHSTELQAAEAASFVWDEPKTYWQRVAVVTPSHLLESGGFRNYFSILVQTLNVFRFPAVLYAGLQWGAQDAWLTFYLTVEEDNYYEDPWNYGDSSVALMNIPTLIGAVIGCFYGGWFSDRFVEWMARRRGGISEAEDRLWLMYPAAIIAPAGLMLFGIGSGEGWLFPRLWAPYVGLGFIGFGWGCAGDLGLSYLSDCYPDMILEGMVGVAVINNSIALIFTFCTGIWMETQTLSQVFIAISVLSFVFFMTTAPMQYWGKTARRKTAARYIRFVEKRDCH